MSLLPWRYGSAGDPVLVERQAERERILSTLGTELQTAEEIAQAADVLTANARKRLSELHDERKIEREGQGKKNDPYGYRLAPDTGDATDTASAQSSEPVAELDFDALLDMPTIAADEQEPVP